MALKQWIPFLLTTVLIPTLQASKIVIERATYHQQGGCWTREQHHDITAAIKDWVKPYEQYQLSVDDQLLSSSQQSPSKDITAGSCERNLLQWCRPDRLTLAVRCAGGDSSVLETIPSGMMVHISCVFGEPVITTTRLGGALPWEAHGEGKGPDRKGPSIDRKQPSPAAQHPDRSTGWLIRSFLVSGALYIGLGAWR